MISQYFTLRILPLLLSTRQRQNDMIHATFGIDAINERMRGGDQTAATKAPMAEAKVGN